ncbi:folylpolyglutamate synthase/dihydrofolate synthase family protein [Flavobacterium sp. NKUCC04_CG]|uniref:bifunctional folylpolyglutamate synthase/dihydrofolate synthase n=1 Tax=Flavobacterium sp. NKUCC04_CG TaxID=2842121 RepID=UPI001C5BDE23|nr:folylpolyglutamate synthase/dihydrofolate synthase family protein [Flavobacterium sp. NKUCC04_CG]MBW3519761.1 bifunctional folylpolyglutamate synthase/dihydrofolate synthase [Flavobacterium sp. NKUCC04_CG]
MSYQETLDWMFSQLPMYQRQGASAYKKDLTNTLKLVEHLGHPEKGLKMIHVAGTNGKGSTSSMIASVLQEAGYKVGLYTSPHLKDFRERIRINGIEISAAFVCEFIANNKTFFEENDLSFFEMTVGMAFEYFQQQAVDVAVIEVGMGGRLDSTNIITPLVSVITNIGMDHTAFLGNSLAEIAYEKAGIIKAGIPVVIGEYDSETQPVFLKRAMELHAPIFFASDLMKKSTHTADLTGAYQMHNIRTARQVLAILRDYFDISADNERNGLLKTTSNTGLEGRWQILQQHPLVIADTAHNSHALKIVLKQLAEAQKEQLFFVLGVVDDKDLSSILPLFPQNAKYFFCKPQVPRGLAAAELAVKAAEFGLNGEVCDSVSAAYQKALKTAQPQDLIYIGGSTFVVAEIL